MTEQYLVMIEYRGNETAGDKGVVTHMKRRQEPGQHTHILKNNKKGSGAELTFLFSPRADGESKMQRAGEQQPK